MKKTHIGAVSIGFAAFLWAFDGVVLTPLIMKLGLYDVPTIVFMLHATGSAFLSYFYFTRKQELQQLNVKDWISFGLVGLFGGAIGTMSIVAAILMVYGNGLNIAVVLLLQKLQPIFAILLAYFWLKERPHPKFYFWAVVAIVGSYFLTFGFGQPSLSAEGMIVPALLAVLAAFSFGSSTVFSKRAIEKVSHGLGTTLRFFMTAVIMLVIIMAIVLLKVVGIETDYLGLAGFGLLNTKLIGLFILIALTTGATAIFIYYYGLKLVSASKSTIYELVFPVASILLEWGIHDKVLNAGQWVGAVVMFVAIVIITKLKTTVPL